MGSPLYSEPIKLAFFPTPEELDCYKGSKKMENGKVRGGPCHDSIRLQHVFSPLFLCEVLGTWETIPLRDISKRWTWRGHCVDWMNVCLTEKAAGFMHFLLCLYVVAIVEPNNSEPNELKPDVSPYRWPSVPAPYLTALVNSVKGI